MSGDTKSESTVPGYWMYETSGVLRPAVEAYLGDGPMSWERVLAMRAYFRQWMENGHWRGPEVAGLTLAIDAIMDRKGISRWLDLAMQARIDPL